jgi:hypothetical protein
MTLCVCCPEGHTVTVAAELLGRTAACPICFSVFHVEHDLEAARHAREKKASRSRDDDDEDEDEKPQVKKNKDKKSKGDDKDKIVDEKLVKKKPKKTEDEEKSKKTDEKSAKKKATKKADDEDEDEEKEEEEEEIEWTPRKRQLHLCIIGQYLFIAAIGVMILFAVVFMVIMDWFIHGVGQLMNAPGADPGRVPWGEFFVVLLAFVAAPFVVLAQILLLVGLGFSFAVPAKAEARSLVISAVVFGVLFFLMGLLGLLGHYEIVVEGEVRAANMVKLMGGVAGLCFIISLMSAMAFQAKLLGFMRLSLEASQAITNFGFYFLFFFLTFILFVANAYICFYLHYLLAYVILLGVDALFALGIRATIAQIQLTLKLNRAIQAYIREA